MYEIEIIVELDSNNNNPVTKNHEFDSYVDAMSFLHSSNIFDIRRVVGVKISSHPSYKEHMFTYDPEFTTSISTSSIFDNYAQS